MDQMKEVAWTAIEVLEKTVDPFMDTWRWWDDIHHEFVTDWLRSVDAGKTNVSAIEAAKPYLEDASTSFLQLGMYHDALRIACSCPLISAVIGSGLNDWTAGYRWRTASAPKTVQWSPTMIRAVDALGGVPYRFQRDINEAAMTVISESAPGVESAQSVLRMRTFATKWMTSFRLQNPHHFEDTIGCRILGEIEQMKILLAGMASSLPTPPGDWLTPKPSAPSPPIEPQENRSATLEDVRDAREHVLAQGNTATKDRIASLLREDGLRIGTSRAFSLLKEIERKERTEKPGPHLD